MDAKSVSMSMINEGERNNCITLADFNSSGVASDRGVEHAIVQYYEVTYDPYLHVPNLYWSIAKQNYCQCVLCFVIGSFIVCVHFFPLPFFST